MKPVDYVNIAAHRSTRLSGRRWQTRRPGKSGKYRPSAAMMAGLAGHVWTFDELFAEVLGV